MEIDLENITKIYDRGVSETTALEDVSIRIAPGEFFFLLGPSGCGKTTLLRIIAGLIGPSAGRILFDKKDVTHLSAEKRNTAMVFQGYALWPHMTVLENVEFGPKMQHMGRDEGRIISREQLSRVRMSDFERRRPNQLSGGQQQRVALARALAAGSDCLLLDEPLSNLDARLRLFMRGELRRLVKSTGATAIYVTHDQKEALSMADRIGVMREGRIVQVGSPDDLYNKPSSRFVADFLGEANFIKGRLTGTDGPAKVETAIGTILVSDAGEIGTGGEVTCCVRPERIIVKTGKESLTGEEGTLLRAKIVSETYLGDIRQYICSLREGEDILWKITMLAGSGERLMESEEIDLFIRADDVTLLTG